MDKIEVQVREWMPAMVSLFETSLLIMWTMLFRVEKQYNYNE